MMILNFQHIDFMFDKFTLVRKLKRQTWKNILTRQIEEL